MGMSLEEKLKRTADVAQQFDHYVQDRSCKDGAYFGIRYTEMLCWCLDHLTYDEQQELFKREIGLKDMLDSFSMFKAFIKKS